MGRIDPLTPRERSERMRLIKGRDTKPEMRIRSALHALGYRYRLHGESLPGKPDLVFASRKKVVFVHGCFWHWHQPCSQYRFPRSRVAFWKKKLSGNRARDRKSVRQLRRGGWKTFIAWECQLKDFERLLKNVRKFLDT